MPVPMVQVRDVRMSVQHRLVRMLVDVGLGAFIAAMRVLVVLIVDVTVRMHQALMQVLVRMQLRQHEPGRDRHQRGGGEKAGRDRLCEQWHGERRADERSSAEMRRRPRRTQVPQRVDRKSVV